MESKQSDNVNTKQTRMHAELHRLAKIKAADEKRSLKSVVDEGVSLVLGVDVRLFVTDLEIRKQQER